MVNAMKPTEHLAHLNTLYMGLLEESNFPSLWNQYLSLFNLFLIRVYINNQCCYSVMYVCICESWTANPCEMRAVTRLTFDLYMSGRYSIPVPPLASSDPNYDRSIPNVLKAWIVEILILRGAPRQASVKSPKLGYAESNYSKSKVPREWKSMPNLMSW
jgi:hypothetical protein